MMIRFRASWLRSAVSSAVVAAASLPVAFSPVADAETSSPTVVSPASARGAETRAAGAGASIASASGQSEPLVPPATTTGAEAPMAFAPSGFYLRAGFALDWSKETQFKDKAGACVSPTHLYLPRQGVCNRLGNDGAPLSSVGDFGAIAGFEVGAGYAAAPFLRLEGAVQYRPSYSFRGRSNFLDVPLEHRQAVSAEVSSLSAMLGVYLDLLGLGRPRVGPFSPFVGGGIGLSRIDIDETRMQLPKTTTIVPGGRRVNLAWMLTAGVAKSLGERMTLDLAWRFTDSGTVETGRGKGRVVWRDGSREPLTFDLAETRADLTSHGLHVSIRYAF